MQKIREEKEKKENVIVDFLFQKNDNRENNNKNGFGFIIINFFIIYSYTFII